MGSAQKLGGVRILSLGMARTSFSLLKTLMSLKCIDGKEMEINTCTRISNLLVSLVAAPKEDSLFT